MELLSDARNMVHANCPGYEGVTGTPRPAANEWTSMVKMLSIIWQFSSLRYVVSWLNVFIVHYKPWQQLLNIWSKSTGDLGCSDSQHVMSFCPNLVSTCRYCSLCHIGQTESFFFKYFNLKKQTPCISTMCWLCLVALAPLAPVHEVFILQKSMFHLHSHTTLPLHRARELFKPSKDTAGLLVCIKKNWRKFVFRVFCGWCHKWGRLKAILAQVTWPLLPTTRGYFFDSSFYWKLGYYLSLWLAFWHFWFKSYDLKITKNQ